MSSQKKSTKTNVKQNRIGPTTENVLSGSVSLLLISSVTVSFVSDSSYNNHRNETIDSRMLLLEKKLLVLPLK